MMQARLWAGVAACVAVAVASGFGERRRSRRDDPDRVGWVAWQPLQFLALFLAFVLAAIGLTG